MTQKFVSNFHCKKNSLDIQNKPTRATQNHLKDVIFQLIHPNLLHSKLLENKKINLANAIFSMFIYAEIDNNGILFSVSLFLILKSLWNFLNEFDWWKSFTLMVIIMKEIFQAKCSSKCIPFISFSPFMCNFFLKW